MADHMIISYREKAEKWVHQAENAQRRVYMDTLTRFKYQDASYYQELAAQCFRAAKRFQDAGVAYKQCGRMEERLKNVEVAASFYHEAALCFQKDDPQEAATCYLSSINLYCQVQRFSTAARLEVEVAELMKKDRNRPLAILHYVKAADFYRANTCCDKAADRCLLKAAHSLGLCERYVEAATLFQEVGHRMLVDDLLKFNSPDVFLKAVFCLQCASGIPAHLQKDVAAYRKSSAEPQSPRPMANFVKATIASLAKASPLFQSSRAYLFASDVALAEMAGDLDMFAARVYAYDNVCQLDAWYLSMLKEIAGHVEEKSVKLKKMRATQDKLRRRQLAEERARTRIRSQQESSTKGDSPEEVSSESDRASSSEANMPTNTPAHSSKPRPDSFSATSDSESGLDSIASSASLGTKSNSSSSSSLNVGSPSGSSSGSSSSGSESGSEGGSTPRSTTPESSNALRKTAAKQTDAGSRGDSSSGSSSSSMGSESECSDNVEANSSKIKILTKSAKDEPSTPSRSEYSYSYSASESAESTTKSPKISSSGSSDAGETKAKSAGKNIYEV